MIVGLFYGGVVVVVVGWWDRGMIRSWDNLMVG